MMLSSCDIIGMCAGLGHLATPEKALTWNQHISHLPLLWNCNLFTAHADSSAYAPGCRVCAINT